MAGQLTDHDLDEIYAFAVQLGKDAGKMLMDRARLRMSGPAQEEEQKFVEKENAVDIVTQTDTGTLNPASCILRPCALAPLRPCAVDTTTDWVCVCVCV